MITGIYQSIPLIIVLVSYYILDTYLIRRFNPERHITEKRDLLNNIVISIAIVVVVIQPVILPWWGIQITAWWGLAIQAIGATCLVSGLILIVWVRLHLRELFSEQVELQPEHYVVDTGPYALVRHPMYTAFFLMLFGQLLVKPAIFEGLLLCFGIWHFSKLARGEEVLLSKELPGYKEYMDVTPRFVPSFRRGRKNGEAVNGSNTVAS